jgi:nucleotide-binding universal stress UspA family protein
MTRPARLLAATDLSGPSLRAVDRGFRIARDTGAAYTIMHAVGLDAAGAWRELLGAQADTVSEKAVARLRDTLGAIAADPGRHHGVTADLRVVEGYATDEVPACARALGADLVLVGAHGQGFLQRVLLGSTTSTLLRRAQCPVLVVKEPVRGAYRRVLVPIDFSPGSEHAIRMTRELAPAADLLLLHVFAVPFEGMLQYAGVDEDIVHDYRIRARERALQQLHALADRIGLGPTDYTAVVEHGDATRRIVSVERRHACDLVVMGKHGRHLTEELLIGSVTKRVLAESRSDVLVVVDERHPVAAAIPGGSPA